MSQTPIKSFYNVKTNEKNNLVSDINLDNFNITEIKYITKIVNLTDTSIQIPIYKRHLKSKYNAAKWREMIDETYFKSINKKEFEIMEKVWDQPTINLAGDVERVHKSTDIL